MRTDGQTDGQNNINTFHPNRTLYNIPAAKLTFQIDKRRYCNICLLCLSDGYPRAALPVVQILISKNEPLSISDIFTSGQTQHSVRSFIYFPTTCFDRSIRPSSG